MGVVYRARSLSGRVLAIKVIRPELAQDPAFRDRFRREVAAARRVSGAFTAPVVDADVEGVSPWLATLFVAGPSLAERVSGGGPLNVGEVRRLAAGLADALRDIHRAGLVHRDLKPGNVLLAEDGPRVIDFGIARAVEATQLTRTGTTVGTPPFMAPEQFRDGTVGPAADVFALGSVLVYAATGHGPFDGDTSHAIGFRVVYEEPDLTGLPEDLRSVVTACLAKDAAGRPTPEMVLESVTGGRADSEALVPSPSTLTLRTTGDVRTDTVESHPESSTPFSVGLQQAAPSPQPRTGSGATRRTVIAAVAATVVAAVTIPLLVSQVGDRDEGSRSNRLGTSTAPSPSATSCALPAATMRGSGSSTQKQSVNNWIAGYRQLCPDDEVVYEGSGAGVGLLDFSLQKDSEFALLNEPMTPSQASGADRRCAGAGTLQIPVVTLPVAVVFRLQGVGSLVLDASTVAGVFNGRVTRWNDPAIARLNRATPLPDMEIRVFHHRGVSPATLILTHYLAGAAPEDWPYRADEAMPVRTGDGLLDEDIAWQLSESDGTISYLPLAMAQSNKLTTAALDTGGEEPVRPETESLARGAEQARPISAGGTDLALDVDHSMRSPGAYPIFRFGYAVTCTRATSESGPTAVPFLRYALSGPAQLAAERNGLGRLPSKVRNHVLGTLGSG
ncbi:protein kinase [Streptomyces parvus]|uniref:Protein kinase n=2 Tax=Streptomyces parvus TaxID=66428 RepID=A0A5D4IES8_9ACTN|nr:protein kinase [Streptomyces parvus]